MKSYCTTLNGVLYQTDCLELLANMKSETIDTVFADPPFNIGKDYKNGFVDTVSKEEYYKWCEQWIFECCRVLKPGGAFFLYALPEIAVRLANILEKRMQFRHWIALTMKGSYPRGNKLYPAHYALLYYTRGQVKTFNHLRIPIPACRHCGKELKDYGGHRDKLNPEGINLSDFWEDTSPNRHKKFKVRPGVNELKLIIPERAILISTNEMDIVFDPFGGGGSTYEAAEKNNRRWIGTELYDGNHIETRMTSAFPFSAGKIPNFSYKELMNENNDDEVLRWIEGKNMQARAV